MANDSNLCNSFNTMTTRRNTKKQIRVLLLGKLSNYLIAVKTRVHCLQIQSLPLSQNSRAGVGWVSVSLNHLYRNQTCDYLPIYYFRFSTASETRGSGVIKIGKRLNVKTDTLPPWYGLHRRHTHNHITRAGISQATMESCFGLRTHHPGIADTCQGGFCKHNGVCPPCFQPFYIKKQALATIFLLNYNIVTAHIDPDKQCTELQFSIGLDCASLISSRDRSG